MRPKYHHRDSGIEPAEEMGFLHNTSRQNVRPVGMDYVLSDTLGLVNNRRGGHIYQIRDLRISQFLQGLERLAGANGTVRRS